MNLKLTGQLAVLIWNGTEFRHLVGSTKLKIVTKGIITKGYPFEKMISSLFFNFRQFHRLGLVWLVFERLKNRIRNRLDPNLKIFLSLFSSRIERFKNSKKVPETGRIKFCESRSRIGREIVKWKHPIKKETGEFY